MMHNTHEEHYTSKTPICNLFVNLNGKVLLKRVYPIKKRNSAVFNRFVVSQLSTKKYHYSQSLAKYSYSWVGTRESAYLLSSDYSYNPEQILTWISFLCLTLFYSKNKHFYDYNLF